MKSEGSILKINTPSQFAPQSIGIIKSFGEIQSEEWQTDGSLITKVYLSAGSRITLLNRLNSLTKGNISAEEIN